MTHKGNVPEHFHEIRHMLGAICSPMNKYCLRLASMKRNVPTIEYCHFPIHGKRGFSFLESGRKGGFEERWGRDGWFYCFHGEGMWMCQREKAWLCTAMVREWDVVNADWVHPCWEGDLLCTQVTKSCFFFSESPNCSMQARQELE